MTKSNVRFLDTPPESDQVKSLVYLSKPKGLDYISPLSRIDSDHLAEMSNFVIRDGRYTSRPGSTPSPGAHQASANILGIAHFFTPAGVEKILLFQPTGVQYFNGVGWSTATGPALTAPVTGHYTWVAWGDDIIFANGEDPLMQYDTATNTYAALPNSPTALHVTTFAGRVIASGIIGNPTWIQWSVKNDSTDWLGVGSGYEDLVSAPSLVPDKSVGVYPISDVTALLVRRNSVWGMYQTGDVDAPFRFSLLHPNFGTGAYRSIVSVAGGIMGYFRDSVYVVGETERINVGLAISPRIAFAASNDVATAIFDPRWQEYRLNLNPRLDDVPNPLVGEVFRYNVAAQAWTRDVYHYPVWEMAPRMLGQSSGFPNNVGMFWTYGVQMFAENSNEANDRRIGGLTFTALEPSLTTGYIMMDPRYKTRVIDVQIELDIKKFAPLLVPMTMWRSVDGVGEAEEYGAGVVADMLNSTIVHFRETYEDRRIQLTLKTAGMNGLVSIVDMEIRAALGPREVP